MKEKLEKQIIKNTIIFFLYIYLTELIIRFNIGSTFFSWGTLRIAISSLIMSILISLIISNIKKIYRNIIVTITSLFIMVYAWIEVNLYFYLGFFMGVGNAEQGTKVTDYIKEYISAARLGTYLVIILFIIINLYYWYIEKKLKEKKLAKTTYSKFEIESKKRKTFVYLTFILITIILSFSFYGTLKLKIMQNKLQSTSNINLLKNPENSNLSVTQFGVLTYGITDILSNILKIEENFEFNYINTDHNSLITDDTRYINDDAWELLIASETNKTYNNLNNYFINREITPKNQYTGIFEDKNLIVILMESVGEIAINPELFPNIYKLYDEGITFTNNYSPRNTCSTGNNELTSITSLYTINKTCNANTYKNNSYFQSLFNMFNDLGYHTTSYHNYPEFYYSRRIIHHNLGSMIYRNATDLNIEWSALYEEWPSDVDLIEASTEYFLKEDKFVAYLTTVTTHQPYSVNSVYGDKYLDKLSDYDYSISLKRYLSKLMELDKAVGLLIQKLDDANILDDTVIALFGDHYPYGLSEKDIKNILGDEISLNNEVDRTPLIIYNQAQEPIKINKYTSLVDVLPTILNLFNVQYDPRLYFGDDIFSDYDDKVVFADSSWQNEKGFYKSTSGDFIYHNEEEAHYTEEELIEINYQIHVKQKMSALAIKNNYYNYLKTGLNKYEKEIINEE